MILRKNEEYVDPISDSDDETSTVKNGAPASGEVPITWKKNKGTLIKPIFAMDIAEQKLETNWSNKPELNINRFSHAIKFFKLFFTEKILKLVYTHTQYAIHVSIFSKVSRKVNDVTREEIN